MQFAPTRILIVEDEDQARTLLENIFVLAGFAVQTATNGAEALRRLRDRDNVPDLVVLDLLYVAVAQRTHNRSHAAFQATARAVAGHWAAKEEGQ